MPVEYWSNMKEDLLIKTQKTFPWLIILLFQNEIAEPDTTIESAVSLCVQE